MNFNSIPEKILWILQRASAVLNLIIITYIFCSLNISNLGDYFYILGWVNYELNKFVLLVLFFSIGLHSSLGLSVILDDYIHEQKIKKFLLFSKNLFIISFWGLTGICLYLI
mgnify:CR=1 FL=1